MQENSGLPPKTLFLQDSRISAANRPMPAHSTPRFSRAAPTARVKRTQSEPLRKSIARATVGLGPAYAVPDRIVFQQRRRQLPLARVKESDVPLLSPLQFQIAQCTPERPCSSNRTP